jgi:hypothetical protein
MDLRGGLILPWEKGPVELIFLLNRILCLPFSVDCTLGHWRCL